jgi:hypothetical protein
VFVRVFREELPVEIAADSIGSVGEVDDISGGREMVVSGSSCCLRDRSLVYVMIVCGRRYLSFALTVCRVPEAVVGLSYRSLVALGYLDGGSGLLSCNRILPEVSELQRWLCY